MHTQANEILHEVRLKNHEIAFLKATAEIQKHFSLAVITRKWNAAKLGKPAKEITVKRWLRLGPDTKNPRFETWVIGLASFLA